MHQSSPINTGTASPGRDLSSSQEQGDQFADSTSSLPASPEPLLAQDTILGPGPPHVALLAPSPTSAADEAHPHAHSPPPPMESGESDIEGGTEVATGPASPEPERFRLLSAEELAAAPWPFDPLALSPTPGDGGAASAVEQILNLLGLAHSASIPTPETTVHRHSEAARTSANNTTPAAAHMYLMPPDVNRNLRTNNILVQERTLAAGFAWLDNTRIEDRYETPWMLEVPRAKPLFLLAPVNRPPNELDLPLDAIQGRLNTNAAAIQERNLSAYSGCVFRFVKWCREAGFAAADIFPTPPKLALGYLAGLSGR